jgi:hypothetical protein
MCECHIGDPHPPIRGNKWRDTAVLGAYAVLGYGSTSKHSATPLIENNKNPLTCYDSFTRRTARRWMCVQCNVVKKRNSGVLDHLALWHLPSGWSWLRMITL